MTKWEENFSFSKGVFVQDERSDSPSMPIYCGLDGSCHWAAPMPSMKSMRFFFKPSLSLKKKNKNLSPEDAHVRNAHWLIACLARKGSTAILQIHTHTNTHGAEKALRFAHTNAQTHASHWQQIITAVSQTLTPGSTRGRRRNFHPNSIQAIKLSRSNFVDFLRREGGKKKMKRFPAGRLLWHNSSESDAVPLSPCEKCLKICGPARPQCRKTRQSNDNASCLRRRVAEQNKAKSNRGFEREILCLRKRHETRKYTV